MSPSHPQPSPSPRSPLVRRLDQAVVASLMMAALVSIGVYMLVRGGTSGRLIEIDRAAPQTARFQLDVNEADWPEFTVLPGIGETLARRIVESRGREGPFPDVESLSRVRGIGPRTLEQIRPYLRPLPPAANVAGQ